MPVIRNVLIVAGIATLVAVSVGSLASAMMAGYPPSSKISRGLLPASPGTTEMATLCSFRKTQSGFAAIWYGCEPTSRDQ
jgi:hypothetical protein